MKKLLALLFSFGLLTFMAGCPGKDDGKKAAAGPDDAVLEGKGEATLAPGDKKEVAIKGGKDLKAEVKGEAKVTAKVEGEKLIIEVDKEAKEGAATITVKGPKGKEATYKVTVAKKKETTTDPKVDDVKAAETEVSLEPGKSVDVKLTGTKAETFKIDPEDKGVTAKIDGDKLTITADKEKAADKATFTIKVYADKASKAKHAEIKVTIKK